MDPGGFTSQESVSILHLAPAQGGSRRICFTGNCLNPSCSFSTGWIQEDLLHWKVSQSSMYLHHGVDPGGFTSQKSVSILHVPSAQGGFRRIYCTGKCLNPPCTFSTGWIQEDLLHWKVSQSSMYLHHRVDPGGFTSQKSVSILHVPSAQGGFRRIYCTGKCLNPPCTFITWWIQGGLLHRKVSQSSM